jgi:hypothetical protein
MVAVPAISDAVPKLTLRQIVMFPISQTQPVMKEHIVRLRPQEATGMTSFIIVSKGSF